MSDELPHVLVVTGNNFNLVSGGGITLTNLFRGWPADRLANIHDDATPEDKTVCRHFYRLSSREIRWMWPFSVGQTWYDEKKQQKAACHTESRTDTRAAPDGRFSPGWLQRARAVLGEGIPKYAVLSPPLIDWVRRFRPTVLYGFLGSLEQMGIMETLADLTGAPMAVHMMDDWPSVLYRRGLLAPLVGPSVRRQLRRVLERATVRMGICDDMCEEYRARYGYQFLPFQNALDIGGWVPNRRRQWKAGDPFVVRYAGSIVPDGQRQSLLDICRAVDQLASDGIRIELWVNTSHGDAAYLREAGYPSAAVRLGAPPAQDEIADLLARSDLLVLPYNFDARSAQYIKLSLPTKAPAYMISGTPVLVYAPANVATARYAAREGWGHVVSHPGVMGVCEALRQLMHDEALRQQLGERGHALACERHNAQLIRPAFWQVLKDAARAPLAGAA